MQPISLQMQTIYADLVQSMEDVPVRAGTISRRRIKGSVHVYSIEKDGAGKAQRYLGPLSDPATIREIENVRRAAALAKIRRTSVTALKSARIPAPSLAIGRVFEVLANAGLFRHGAVLVGTAAFQLYPCIVGAYLSASALQTQDADLGLTELALRASKDSGDIGETLMRADPSYRPKFHTDHRLPLAFQSADGFSVELLTTMRRTNTPIPIAGLGCAAQPLHFLDYLLEEPVWAVALYNGGVRVRVPDPARYAVHKLIVANERGPGAAKRQKDLRQVEELFAAFAMVRNLGALEEALAAARRRGPKWRSAIAASLKAIELPAGLSRI